MFTLPLVFSICSQSRKLECCKGFANTKGKCESKENIKKYNAIFFNPILVSLIAHIKVSKFDKVIKVFKKRE